MLRAYKYRIYPTPTQREQIDRNFGVCRFLYNLAMETRIRAWESARVNLSAYDLQKQVTELKKDYDWMRAASSEAINAALNNMEVAYRSFFNGGGFPKFKSKVGRQSYTVPCPRKISIDFEKSLVNVPKIRGI